MITAGSLEKQTTSPLLLSSPASPRSLISRDPALAALPVTSSPELKLARTIRTSPFVGSSISMKDGEGSAYVPRDNSLWLADDNGRAVYEVNPTTGALKQKISGSSFEAAPKLGGGSQAGTNRDRDIEAMAYDEATDTLYAFSGPCCRRRSCRRRTASSAAAGRIQGGVVPAPGQRVGLHRRRVGTRPTGRSTSAWADSSAHTTT